MPLHDMNKAFFGNLGFDLGLNGAKRMKEQACVVIPI